MCNSISSQFVYFVIVVVEVIIFFIVPVAIAFAMTPGLFSSTRRRRATESINEN